ncbi:hypothetical protein K227x_18360 [Rubripirellula lacrimiformis]|uniref:DUF1549 domain-containing protein n=1 Tax=Rubripirellula lacrimiformis TaxID=1930273 RepID=A0A517N8K0_9BACT|nr:DUF1549 domain-containing protein [Rubripirellula lacrimiformis]QDT03452.1 hypothetical protein K227x_18360 [Rubripirellula lacrimiformis]
MSRSKTFLLMAARWGWFGLLMLLVFGYMAAGLSEPGTPQAAAHAVAVTNDSLAAEPATDALQPPSPIASPDQNPAGDVDKAGYEEKPGNLVHTVANLDSTWRDSLAESGYQPADPANWMTVCRRISLAMVGSGMSLEEIRELERLPEHARADAHLERLLVDPRFHHYWSERWTRFLVGTDEGQFVVYRRRRFRIWLSEQFAGNVRYDQLVRQLITAEGLWTDKPEVNFLTSTYDSNDNSPDPIRLAARTSRAFLGLRIDCLQCHDDFLGNVNLGDVESPREGLQTDFHQLAAFYTSAKSNGLQGVRSGQPDYQYQYLHDDDETDVEPSVPYSPELLPADGDARVRLAAWITHPENHQAARAAVSHVWALMYGRPAGEAVDNLPLDEASSPLAQQLATDFIDHQFNLRRLIRLIAKSAAFRADSRIDGIEISEAMERAGAVFPLVRLRPEQVAGAIIQASRIKRTDRDSALLLQLITLTTNNDFVKRYGDIGEDEFTTDSVTITQRLLMMNGKMLRELTEDNPVLNASSHARMFAEDDSAIVDTIYLCALNRYPTKVEHDHFVGQISDAKFRRKTIEDLMWVLLNSSELAWNH